jgi:hypothetical protein
MRWNVTSLPAPYLLLEPPAEVTVTSPWVGTACTDIFQPMRRASASMATGVWAMLEKSPRQAMPVDTLL